MSLAIVIKSPSGLVVAADSRVTLIAKTDDEERPVMANFDNATKLLLYSDPNTRVAAAHYGQAVIPPGSRTPQSYIPEFEATLPGSQLDVRVFAAEMSKFFAAQWAPVENYDGPEMLFYVGGFDDTSPYGQVFQFSLPTSPEPQELHGGGFGASWGGQLEIVNRIIKGFDIRLPQILISKLGLTSDQERSLHELLREFEVPLPFPAMPLQDCVDLALILMRTTIGIQSVSMLPRGVGGPIDLVTITRTEGVHVVQRKQIRGE